MKKSIFFVIYDSVLNSAFKSQVFNRIEGICLKNFKKKVFLISFEPDLKKANKFLKNLNFPENLEIKLFYRTYFFSEFFIYFHAKKLSSFFQGKKVESVFSRGVISAFVCLKALETLKLFSVYLKILVPGILSQEAILFSQNSNFFRKVFSFFKIKLFIFLENKVFNSNSKLLNNFKNFFFEVVSSSMKESLVKLFNARRDKIFLANFKPEKFLAEEKLKCREKIRKKLGIKFSDLVYVYSGSIKPWQGFDLSLDFFLKKLRQNKKSFFLVLSKDFSQVLKALERKNIDKKRFLILSLEQPEVKKYLLASDFGLIFRKDNIVNWTARPIKAMEYLSAGLLIEHNFSVEWVIKNC